MGQTVYFTYLDQITDINQLSATGENLFCCPFCSKQDGKQKLCVNLEKNKYHCWRCEAKGSAYSLLRQFSNIDSSQLKDFAFEQFTPKTGWDKKRFLIEQDEKSDIEETTFMYDDISVDIFKSHLYHAQQYLLKRGLSPEEIKYYDIRVGSPFSDYKGRILIPTYDDNHNVTYLIARDYVNKDPERKYYNAKGTNKSIHVWNLNNAKQNDTIILTEGCFSGISANRIPDMTAVCIYGKSISVRQAKLIAKKEPKELIISLDPDVPANEIKKNVETIRLFYNGLITWAHLPVGKDPNDLSLIEYQEVIDKREIYYLI